MEPTPNNFTPDEVIKFANLLNSGTPIEDITKLTYYEHLLKITNLNDSKFHNYHNDVLGYALAQYLYYWPTDHTDLKYIWDTLESIREVDFNSHKNGLFRQYDSKSKWYLGEVSSILQESIFISEDILTQHDIIKISESCKETSRLLNKLSTSQNIYGATSNFIDSICSVGKFHSLRVLRLSIEGIYGKPENSPDEVAERNLKKILSITLPQADLQLHLISKYLDDLIKQGKLIKKPSKSTKDIHYFCRKLFSSFNTCFPGFSVISRVETINFFRATLNFVYGQRKDLDDINNKYIVDTLGI